MRDYFSNLAARTMGLAQSMEPRPRSRFEPPSLSPEAVGPVPFDEHIETTLPENENVAPEIMAAMPITERRRSRLRTNMPDATDVVPQEDREPDATNISIGLDAAAHDSTTKDHASLQRPPGETRLREEVYPVEASSEMPASREPTVSDRRAVEITRPVLSAQTTGLLDTESSSVPTDSKAMLSRKAADTFPSSPQPAITARNVRPTGENSMGKPVRSIDYNTDHRNTTPTDSRIPGSTASHPVTSRNESSRIDQTNVASFPIERVSDRGNGFNESRSPVQPERISLAIDANLSSRVGAARNELGSRADPESTIQITIGRVEVKAVTAPTTRTLNAAPAKTATSLDDYLRKRSSGGR